MPNESAITDSASTRRAVRSIGGHGRVLAWSRWVAIGLLLAALAPSSLSASCGHYVTSGPQVASSLPAWSMPGRTTPADRDAAAETAAGLAGQLVGTANFAKGHDAPCANGQCHNPCRNGQCQRAPAGLPPAPASQINQTLQQWAWLAAALVSDSPRFAFPLVIESRNVHAGYPPSIDHPPQNSYV